jgi:hypothetical protein
MTVKQNADNQASTKVDALDHDKPGNFHNEGDDPSLCVCVNAQAHNKAGFDRLGHCHFVSVSMHRLIIELVSTGRDTLTLYLCQCTGS